MRRQYALCHLWFVFFYVLRGPPRSPLFPYTTLFRSVGEGGNGGEEPPPVAERDPELLEIRVGDRKSTRLNSSHRCISYAVFCLKKKQNLSDANYETTASLGAHHMSLSDCAYYLLHAA